MGVLNLYRKYTCKTRDFGSLGFHTVSSGFKSVIVVGEVKQRLNIVLKFYSAATHQLVQAVCKSG